MSKDVATKIYKFNELNESVQENLIEEYAEHQVDFQFETFGTETAPNILTKYGLEDAELIYTLMHGQSDGLYFEISRFLTSQIIAKIKEAIRELPEKNLLLTAFKYALDAGERFVVRHFGNFERALEEDVQYASDCCSGYDYQYDHPNTKYTQQKLDDAFDAILDIARGIYLDICKELMDVGYDCYDVDRDTVVSALSENEYYVDGRVYNE